MNKLLAHKNKSISLIVVLVILVNACVCAQMPQSVQHSIKNKSSLIATHHQQIAGMEHASHSCCDEVAVTDCCPTKYVPASSETLSTDIDFTAIVSSWPYSFTTLFNLKIEIDSQLFLVSSPPPIYLINCVFLN